jgi:hypothetical protein
MTRCAWESRPGAVTPTPWGRPSPPLYDTVRRGRCQPRGTVLPTFVRLTRRALEGGPAEPSNGGKCFFYDYTGLPRDVRPVGTVFSVAVSPVRISPPLQRHAGYCDDIPNTVEAHGDWTSPCPHCTSYGPPLTAPSSRPVGGGRTTNLYATTLEVAPVRAQDSPRRPNRSEIRQDSRLLHGTARHAFTHRRTVRHTCKLLSPWPIKGGSVPQPREGGRRIAIIHTLFAFTTILALASINTSGTWRPGLLSRHACSPPLCAPRCNTI